MANTQISTSSAASVLRSPELLESILHKLPVTDILRSQQVCTLWKDLVANSPTLQRTLFYRPIVKEFPSRGEYTALSRWCAAEAMRIYKEFDYPIPCFRAEASGKQDMPTGYLVSGEDAEISAWHRFLYERGENQVIKRFYEQRQQLPPRSELYVARMPDLPLRDTYYESGSVTYLQEGVLLQKGELIDMCEEDGMTAREARLTPCRCTHCKGTCSESEPLVQHDPSLPSTALPAIFGWLFRTLFDENTPLGYEVPHMWLDIRTHLSINPFFTSVFAPEIPIKLTQFNTLTPLANEPFGPQLSLKFASSASNPMFQAGEASWRSMHITQPPPRAIALRVWRNHCHCFLLQRIIRCRNGVTIGAVVQTVEDALGEWWGKERNGRWYIARHKLEMNTPHGLSDYEGQMALFGDEEDEGLEVNWMGLRMVEEDEEEDEEDENQCIWH